MSVKSWTWFDRELDAMSDLATSQKSLASSTLTIARSLSNLPGKQELSYTCDGFIVAVPPPSPKDQPIPPDLVPGDCRFPPENTEDYYKGSQEHLEDLPTNGFPGHDKLPHTKLNDDGPFYSHHHHHGPIIGRRSECSRVLPPEDDRYHSYEDLVTVSSKPDLGYQSHPEFSKSETDLPVTSGVVLDLDLLLSDHDLATVSAISQPTVSYFSNPVYLAPSSQNTPYPRTSGSPLFKNLGHGSPELYGKICFGSFDEDLSQGEFWDSVSSVDQQLMRSVCLSTSLF
eukprot:sb/3467782/